jgi:hypothetical protein
MAFVKFDTSVVIEHVGDTTDTRSNMHYLRDRRCEMLTAPGQIGQVWRYILQCRMCRNRLQTARISIHWISVVVYIDY